MRVELQQVDKRFGAVHALRQVSLDIPSGRAVALVGPNGSGKSTLSRAVMGLVGVAGAIRFDGEPRHAALAGRLAYVPQIAPQLAAPVRELVQMVCSVRGAAPDAVADLARALDLDLAAVAKQGFKNLSGGMKQKLLVALALAPGADLLLMDEPTASLDATARGRFFEVFAERRAGATLILTSHRLEEIRHLVDHVVALQDGAVIYDGPASAYLAEREQSLIELLVAPEADTTWLGARGFHPGASGWWVKVVGREEKLATLPEVVTRLAGRLENIVVRDFERLDPHREPAPGPHPSPEGAHHAP